MKSISKKEWIFWAVLTGIFVIVTLFVGRASAYVEGSMMDEVEGQQGGNIGKIVPVPATDGTYNFVWTSVNRKASSRTLMYTIGYEVSMLKTDPLTGTPVNPNDPKYQSYNNDDSCGPQGDRDPHYYDGNGNRVSFVLNRLFVDNGIGKNSGDWITVDEGERTEDRGGKQRVVAFRFSQNVLESGIQSTGNAAWRTQWENFIHNGSYFAFGIDSVIATSNNDGIGTAGVPGIVKEGTDGKLEDKKGNKIPDPQGDIYKNEVGSKLQSLWDAMYIAREWAYSLDGYPTSVNYSGAYQGSANDKAKSYMSHVRVSEFLQKDNYGNASGFPPMSTWRNWSAIEKQVKNPLALIPAITRGSYKIYFDNQLPITINPPDTRHGSVTNTNTSQTLILTKQKDSTKNVSVGLDEGMSGDANSAPEIYTYNNDNTGTFDIGDAIPTTETYTNAVEDDQWYGSVPIYKVTVKTTFKVPYTVYWTQGYDVNTTAPSNETTWVQGTVHVVGSHSYLTYASYTKTDTFYQIGSVNLYQLVSSDITNDSAGGSGGSGANVNYPFNIKIPYSCTINGREASKDNATGPYLLNQSIYDLLNTNYVNYTNGSSRQTIDQLVQMDHAISLNGEFVTTPTSAIEQAVTGDLKNKVDSIYTTKSDTFSVAGHTYLTENGLMDQLDREFNGDFSYHEMNETDPQYEKSTAEHPMTIGKDVKNGKYYTDLLATYQRFITDDSTRVLSVLDRKYFFDDTRNTLAIKDGNIPNTTTPYTHNEPVVVFSPVIAPISISGSDATQLTNKTGEHHGLAQMRLDGTYRVNFDWNDYYQEKGYDLAHASGWANYVKKKYLSFPFSVYVKSETLADGTVNNIGKYYEPESNTDTTQSAGSGYTGWIAFSDTAVAVDIYIPTWAREGIYGGSMVNITTSDFDSTNNRPIAVRAEANNVPDDLTMQGEWQSNTNGKADANYVATFDLPVEISGWLYGFTVESVKTTKNFAPLDWKDEWGSNVYNFVTASHDTNKTEAEKRYGTMNRLGERIGIDTVSDALRKTVRYIYDGTTTNNWDTRNTLPMASGKSTNSNIGGYLDPGNTIAFTIKTIANLSDLNDSVKITPTYRYYDLNGNENDNIDIWYKGFDGTLVRMGSKKDKTKNVNKDSLYSGEGACWRENCYFGNADGELGFYNTFMQTSNYDAKTPDDDTFARTKEGKGYAVGQVTIKPNMRLITGNEEELFSNVAKNSTSANRFAVSNSGGFWNLTKSEYGWEKGDTSYNAPNNGYDFMNSMQTWYGRYWVPEKIYICDKGAAENVLKTEGELSDDTPIWKKSGYLVLNFQIQTYDNDGKEHLEYVTPSGVNMWKNEEGDAPQTFSIDTPLEQGVKITKKDGDVAIINLGRSGNEIPEQSDYETGLLYLN